MTGRWTTPDPVEYEDGPNLYGYVHNNPMNRYDAYGLFEVFSWQSSRKSFSSSYQDFSRGFESARSQGFDDHMSSMSPSTSFSYMCGGSFGIAAATMKPVEDLMEKICPEQHPGQLRCELPGPGLALKIFSTASRATKGSQIVPKIAGIASRRFGGVGSNSLLYNGSKNSSAQSINAAIKLNIKLTAQEIVGGHAFGKHAHEFGFTKTEQMVSHIEKVMTKPSMMKQVSKGRTVYWDTLTNSVVIRDPTALDGGTTFVPRNGVNYYNNGVH